MTLTEIMLEIEEKYPRMISIDDLFENPTLRQLSNYLKVPINYFFDDYVEYSNNPNRTAEQQSEQLTTVNYNFLVKTYGELSQEQKNKFKKLLINNIETAKTG